jgi:hypothetical protein
MNWLKKAVDYKAHFKRFIGFFLVTDGGKKVINKTRTALVAVGTLLIGVFAGIYFSGGGDTSTLAKSHKPLNIGDTPPPQGAQAASGKVGKMLSSSEAKGTGGRPRESRGRGVKVNFKAQQVLVSEGAFDPARTMPMGTNLIGKTLTTIDTRQADQLVKVLLPYGGRAKSGGNLPKNSILFGQVTYGGKGEKVFIKFSKGVLPSGEEFQVEAQVLSPGDYSPGLAGRFHGNADMRVASTLGLTMVSAASNVLTEREALGGGGLLPGAVTPKATMKNALLQGVSQTAQDEATRQSEAIGQEQEYITVDAGTDLIVSLTKAYVQK